MWRSSKRLIISCLHYVIRCGRINLDTDDLDDISDYDVQDVPMHFQPQTFGVPWQPRQDDVQHRPDAPGVRRISPPEVVTKMLRALEEMGESVEPSAVDKTREDTSEPLEQLLRAETQPRTS
ncbi:uncharacterized protein LOC109858470 isoform X2 [Pseudomyrmex gracilis]|uniref:uncharacterized protein LOC109858470 isoform X2 n=1 Tax=Pseudomyrmex gracilis TaxID=219809 RepID=UPI0009957E2A|nr:uncharacterized protein LOC109858470 isoform X2 [Pseudomyrmex gracilis]